MISLRNSHSKSVSIYPCRKECCFASKLAGNRRSSQQKTLRRRPRSVVCWVSYSRLLLIWWNAKIEVRSYITIFYKFIALTNHLPFQPTHPLKKFFDLHDRILFPLVNSLDKAEDLVVRTRASSVLKEGVLEKKGNATIQIWAK